LKLQSQLQISVHQRILIAAPSGELDHHQAERLRAKIDAEYDKASCRHILLDMSGVTFMDSSGIGMIIGRYKNAEASGGRLIICGMSENISKIYEISGLAKIIQRVDSVEAALNFFGCGAQGTQLISTTGLE